MKFSLMFFLSVIALPALAADPTFRTFRKAVVPQLASVPDQEQRKLLDLYISYLGGTVGSHAVIGQLKHLAEKKRHPVASEWVRLFEARSKVCQEGAGSPCGYGLGSASQEKLLPRIRHGDEGAIAIVLVYAAAIKPIGQDGETLDQYKKMIQLRHPDVARRVRESEKSFFRKFPLRMPAADDLG